MAPPSIHPWLVVAVARGRFRRFLPVLAGSLLGRGERNCSRAKRPQWLRELLALFLGHWLVIWIRVTEHA